MKKNLGLLAIISCSALIFSSCQKDYSIENGDMQSAAGSLWDSVGNCLPESVTGTFYDGVTPGSDTAYVEVQVDVTQTGSYNITTGNPENGLVFSDSGFFSTTGINTIRLKPIGTPILVKSTPFSITFDSSICTFNVDVQDSTGTGLGGTQDTTTTGGGDPDNLADNSWQFSANSLDLQGSIISAQFGPSTGGSQLFLVGQMQFNSTDTAFGLSVQFPGTTLDTGFYATSTAGTSFSLTKVSSGDVIFAANNLSPQVITIHISSYDVSTKVVEGTFEGDSYDINSNVVPITEGEFKATVQ
jgi:hypothetical protein